MDAGAKQVTLEGVYHSPLGSSEAKGESPGRPWYGSGAILDQWIAEVVRDASELVDYKVILKPACVAIAMNIHV